MTPRDVYYIPSGFVPYFVDFVSLIYAFCGLGNDSNETSDIKRQKDKHNNKKKR